MADTKVDTKALTDKYVKGATPDDLALEYDLTSQEVVAIVTKEVATTPTVTQAELDAQPEVKKGK
jgi:uncharacterized protein (DUF433 family)